MRLLPIIKKLREIFNQIKIQQRTDELNRIYALFLLENSEDSMTLLFEHDYMLLRFGNLNAVYGYSESDFEYMTEEIGNLLTCKSCVLSVINAKMYCGCMLALDNNLSTEFLENVARRFHYETMRTENFENGYIELKYIDARKNKRISFRNNQVLMDRWSVYNR